MYKRSHSSAIMSATLKSFDSNDDSIAFRKIRSPKLRNLNRRDQNDPGFYGNGHYEDDIEFDDTRMDIDDMKPNSPFNDENMSNNRRSGHDSFLQHDYVIRDTTTKVPLKDSPRTNKASTPDMLDRINKYRSKNGTPLRLPPLNSSQFSNSDNESHSILIEDKAEDSLIKHRKLISDDNKFSPGRTQGSLKKVARDTSNGHIVASPTKTMNRPINEAIITPPSNLKVRPFIFGSASRKLPSASVSRKGLPGKTHVSTSKHDEDIEFDSSDVDGEDGDGATRSRLLSSTTRFNPSNSNQIPKPSSDIKQHTHTNNYNKDDSIELRDEQHISQANPTFESKIEDIQNTSIKETNKKEKYGDISRAEILEKINSTINSLMEKDKLASSPSKINVEDILPQNIDKEIVPAESSDESPEEIINELDSFFSGNKSNTGNQGSADFNHRSPSKFSVSNNDQGLISNGQLSRATPIRTHYSRLSGKYARQIMNRRKNENATNKAYPDMPVLQDSNNIAPGPEWPTSKWLKLNKILQLGKIAKKDILNSEVLIQKLGCASRGELKQRIEFLIQFNESRKINRPKKRAVSNSRKNNLGLKSSKSEKRFQII
ncbi:unnamed protein product [Debaryomyces tyrocola]|nr:unnamed protein product [Debaryomyces tyrocola]